MAAGLQRDIGRGALRHATHAAPRHITGAGDCRQCAGFGMRQAGPFVPALADDSAMPDDDTADTGIGCGAVKAALRQLQGARHEGVIGRRKAHAPPPVTISLWAGAAS